MTTVIPSIPIPSSMKAPGDHKDGIWRGGVLQIKVTNACDLDCTNCSVGVGLARVKKLVFRMTPDNFRKALQSLKGFEGVIGMFGGNPCIHPNFEELCEIFREEIPDKDQRGLWSNNIFGHGEVCRETFGPYCNLNVHQSEAAWDEIRKTWPEAKPISAGLFAPSHHGPIFGSMLELGLTAEEMWERVGKCYVNQTWSAEITQIDGRLYGYFCEIAATMAELAADSRFGMAITEGWWKKSMAAFASQVRQYCTRCLVPMNPRKLDAAGNSPEEYTPVWGKVFATVKGRPLRELQPHDRNEIEGSEPATKYLPQGVMRKE